MSANWGGAGKGDAAPPEAQGGQGVVIGNLQDSCQQFQYQLSAKLARRASCVHSDKDQGDSWPCSLADSVHGALVLRLR